MRTRFDWLLCEDVKPPSNRLLLVSDGQRSGLATFDRDQWLWTNDAGTVEEYETWTHWALAPPLPRGGGSTVLNGDQQRQLLDHLSKKFEPEHAALYLLILLDEIEGYEMKSRPASPSHNDVSDCLEMATAALDLADFCSSMGHLNEYAQGLLVIREKLRKIALETREAVPPARGRGRPPSALVQARNEMIQTISRLYADHDDRTERSHFFLTVYLVTSAVEGEIVGLSDVVKRALSI